MKENIMEMKSQKDRINKAKWKTADCSITLHKQITVKHLFRQREIR